MAGHATSAMYHVSGRAVGTPAVRLHHFADRSDGRQDAEKSQGAGAEHLFAVDNNLELAVAAVLGRDLHLSAQPTTKRRRHPGGVQVGHSVPAAADRHFHSRLPAISETRRRRSTISVTTYATRPVAT